MPASSDTIKVAIDASRKIIIHARGKPAEIVAYGAAGAVVFLAIVGGYGTYQLAKGGISRVKGLLARRQIQKDADDNEAGHTEPRG